MKVAGARNLPGGAGADQRGVDDGGAMGVLDWEEGDRFSFADSDRFEEDSMCSWSSEPESLCNNWRGWKRPTLAVLGFNNKKNIEGNISVNT